MSTPHETVEWRYAPIWQQTDPDDDTTKTLIVTGVQYAIVTDGERAAAWVDADTRDGKPGFVISGLPAGRYRVWAKVTAAPDAPVTNCGTFTLD